MRGRHVRPNRKLNAIAAGTVLAMVIVAGSAAAGPDQVDNIADVIHPNIHQNVTNGNANPGVGNDNGNNLHGIANNPGQSDADPADGEPGFADQLETVHGGIGTVNKNAAGD